MLITCIVLAVVAGVTTGWSARQRQQLLEQEAKIDGLLVIAAEADKARERIESQRVEDLLIENAELKESLASQESCLNLVIDELEKLA